MIMSLLDMNLHHDKNVEGVLHLLRVELTFDL